ncbi:MAG: membrane protein insertase YidC [Methylococcaceae bacterium]|nr:membrane protein insertase YidC [Methylococcaceae bacterium]
MDNLRFVLITTFAMLVFMLYQAWQIDYGPKPEIPAVVETAANTREDLPSTTGQPQTAEQSPVISPVVAEHQATTKIVTVKTDVLAVEIDLQGGTVRSLDLLNYPVEKENTVVTKLRNLIGLSIPKLNTTPVRLFNSEQEKLFVAQSGLIAGADSAPAADHHTVFNSEQNSYELQAGQESVVVSLTWTDNNGLVVNKSFIFKRGSYEISLQQKVKNESEKPWSGRQYSQLLRVQFNENSGGMLTGLRAFDGGVVYTEKEKYKKVSYDDMTDENLDTSSKGGWTAMIQHYFASAWIPPADQENHFYTKKLKDESFVIGSYSPQITVAAHAEVQYQAQLFAGPKIQPVMEKIAPGLELTVDYSVLTFIGKPIYWLLNKIHSLVGNWGFAIIGVTLCIKLLFFPLSQASFKSMAKMRKVQPRLKELQERFADDRQRFNTEMMALYKKEKVNPLGGCLPILIQIPVFMALYWVLGETVEFRQTEFLLWIQDLSIQDPFYILPLIMGVTMKIQQSLNPPPIDPIQAKVIKMFPVVFTVFFLFFPSGLVLYWVVNNTLSIFQQMYITKQIEKEG